MTLKRWQENRWIDAHSSSPDEIARLQLATLAMYAEGYRPGRDRGHERAIESLQFTVGTPAETVDFLDLARRKRNAAQYGAAGGTSSKEVAEMLAVATALRGDVLAWVKKLHPKLSKTLLG